MREWYVFKGWEPVVEEIVTKDMTYVAQWERVKLTAPTQPGQSGGTTITPKTGDTSSLILPIVLVIAAAVVIMSVVLVKKREANKSIKRR